MNSTARGGIDRNFRRRLFGAFLDSGLLAAMVLCSAFCSAEALGESESTEGVAESSDAIKRQYVMMEPKLGAGDASERRNDDPIVPFPPLRRSYGDQLRLRGGVAEQDLAIEWDDWHNDFGRAVASRMFTHFAETLNMKQGLTTWYHCEITADRHVKFAEITKSSGNLWYDKAVLQAIYRLEGSDLLAFPVGSQRSEITTDLGVRMGGAKTGYLRFGDVEYHEVTPGPEHDVPQSLSVEKRKHSRR